MNLNGKNLTYYSLRHFGITARLVAKVPHYEVAKFDDTDTPVDVYRFHARGCSCPARSKSCKHTKMLNAWKRAGSPEGVVYNDSIEEISNIFTCSIIPTTDPR